MKNILLIWLIISPALMAFGQWKIVNEGSNIPLISMDFMDKTLAYAIADSTLYRSDDVGETWQPITCVKCHYQFMKLDFVSENVGFAYAHDDQFYGLIKTTNSGESWERLLDIRGIIEMRVVSEQVIWLVTSSDILRSVNGGKSFTYVFEGTGLNLNFTTCDYMGKDTFVVAGTVRKDDVSYETEVYITRTYDGGKLWQPTILGSYISVTGIEVFDDKTAYVIAAKQTKSKVDFNFFQYSYELVKTTDQFNSFQSIYQHNMVISNVYFITADIGFGLFEVDKGHIILRTTNGGLNWNSVGVDEFPRGLGLYAQFFSFEDNTGYFYYTSGQNIWSWGGISSDIMAVNMRYTDYGENWEQLNFSYKFKDLNALDNGKALLVGGYSMLHFTARGNVYSISSDNQQWHNYAVIPNDPIEMTFISDSVGFIHAYSDLFYYWNITTDSGKTWQVDTAFNESRTVYFGDSLIWSIKALQSTPRRWHYWLRNSSDLGKTWHKIVTTNSSVEYMAFPDANNGWLLTYSDTLIHFNNATGFTVQYTGNKSNLNKLYFIDNKHGWVIGGYSSPYNNDFFPLLLRTTNGGNTWENITNKTYLINDVVFMDENNGWGVGYDINHQGALLETSDGGKNWAVKVETLNGILNAIDYKNGYGWAAGNNGLILAFKDTTITHTPHNSAASELQLSIYPNPASDQTTISFYLPDISMVTVEIVDQLGRIVAMPYKGVLNINWPQIIWQIPDVISGVYYVVIRSNKATAMAPILIY